MPDVKQIEEYLPHVREAVEETIASLALPEMIAGPVLATASPGKMLRAWLLLAVAAALDKANVSHCLVATSVELLHSASLLHDDVVDEAKTRRGRPSLRTQIGNKAAVLTGDMLVATALERVASLDQPRLDELFASKIRIICEGELKHELCMSEEEASDRHYLEVIRKKTGGFFSLAALSPAIMRGCGDGLIERVGKAGELVGIAYQLLDDLADLLLCGEELGKDAANDLRRAKPTLPLIRLARATGGSLFDLARRTADPTAIPDLRREAAAAGIAQEIILEVRTLLADASACLELKELSFNPVTLFVDAQLAAYTEKLNKLDKAMAASN